jgi:hypothetical protein
MNDNSSKDKAVRRAEAKLGFYIHFIVYLAVNAVLAVLNLTRSPDNLWFIWPLLGWGIGVGFHALNVFVFAGTDSSLKKRLIDREVRKEQEEQERQQATR